MRIAIPSLLYSLLSASMLLGAAFASAPDDYPHLRMGVPSEATADEANKNDFLIKKSFYALSYNNSRGTPNWVSWRLTKDDLGKAPRKRVFDPDGDLPAGFKRIVTKDYVGSGFDRGHMCPHSDRTKTKESSFATFVMTNIVPQSAENNQRAWNQLEMYLQDLVAAEGKVCYIVAGPQGKGGTGKNGFKTTIARGQVTVPARTWKVVMVLDEDVDDPVAIGKDTNVRLIAVVVPNDDSVGLDWSKFRTSVHEVEELTGLKFFDKVPSVEDLKKDVDEEPIEPPVPPRRGRDND